MEADRWSKQSHNLVMCLWMQTPADAAKIWTLLYNHSLSTDMGKLHPVGWVRPAELSNLKPICPSYGKDLKI